jgi:hypothetical protein
MDMNHDTHDAHGAPDQQRGFRGRMNWVLIGFLAIAAYFLFTEHRAHVVNFLPFLLLAACPLMHLFHGHGGHGGHVAHGGSGKPDPERRDGAAR